MLQDIEGKVKQNSGEKRGREGGMLQDIEGKVKQDRGERRDGGRGGK